MQHFAALLLTITLSVCSVHCFLVANEGNEKCKEVRRETRTNNALFCCSSGNQLLRLCVLSEVVLEVSRRR